MKSNDELLFVAGAVGLGLYALNKSGVLGGAGKITNAAGDIAEGLSTAITTPLKIGTPEFQESIASPLRVADLAVPPLFQYKLNKAVTEKQKEIFKSPKVRKTTSKILKGSANILPPVQMYKLNKAVTAKTKSLLKSPKLRSATKKVITFAKRNSTPYKVIGRQLNKSSKVRSVVSKFKSFFKR